MKTAEEILNETGRLYDDGIVSALKDEIIGAMKEYALHVAVNVRRDCAVNVKTENGQADRRLILHTKIELP